MSSRVWNKSGEMIHGEDIEEELGCATRRLTKVLRAEYPYLERYVVKLEFEFAEGSVDVPRV